MKRLRTVAALLATAVLVGSAAYYKYDTAVAGELPQASDTQTSEASSSKSSDTVTTLKIAYLPITHALPLFATEELLNQQGNGNVKIELVKYGGWSELMDALNTGRVDGASVLIEMAMKAKEQGIPLELSLLGHKDGNVVITSNDITEPEQLRGKTFAIPNTQSSHNILLQTLLQKNGMSISDVNVVEMAPAEMPSALQGGQIDGYCVAEPFGAKAVDAGIGRVFATSQELWPNSICCGIVLNTDAVSGKEDAVKAFEEAYKEAGASLTTEESQEIAEEYLGQNADVSELSLQWISFKDLDVTKEAYDSLTDKIQEFGLSENPPSFDSFVEHTGG